MTNERFLEITEHTEPGFKPLVIKEGWRAAILNDNPEKYRLDSLCDFERHMKTDEVFVLLEGDCTLLVGDSEEAGKVGTVTPVKMEPKKLYNVKQKVWHNLLGTPGMVLLVVENADTSRDTSEFLPSCEADLSALREPAEKKREVLEWMEKYGLVAIVRGLNETECLTAAEALYRGGIRLMEITYDQKDPSSWQKSADLIARLSEAYRGKMLIGAGTVTSVSLVEKTAAAGGRFIISPDTDPAVIQRSVQLGLVSMPGAMTPSEIKQAHLAGADFVKVFPAGNFGAAYIKAVRAPLGQIKLLAVGGVDENNLAAFLKAGAVGAGIGGNLVNKEWIREGKTEKITETAKKLTEIYRAAKQ